MRVHIDRGISGNEADDESALREAVEASFERVDVRIVGSVALFEVRGRIARGRPRRGSHFSPSRVSTSSGARVRAR